MGPTVNKRETIIHRMIHRKHYIPGIFVFLKYLNPTVLRLVRGDEDLVDIPAVSVLVGERGGGGLHEVRIRHEVA